MDEPPAWLPNWEDESAYPEELTPKGWAWQFLRRNVEYQEDYRVFSALPDVVDGKVSGKWKGIPWLSWPIDCFYCDPPALPAELYEDYMARTKNDYEAPIPWVDHLAKKWGMYPVHDPAESQPFAVGGDPHAYDPPYVLFDNTLPRNLEAWHSPPVIFDLRRSIESQIRKIEDLFNDMRERCGIPVDLAERRKRVEKSHLYKTYLRLLDGESIGASRDEMAERLYPDNPSTDTASKALHAAQRLRDGGYRDLIDI